jgi:hypothetical protein
MRRTTLLLCLVAALSATATAPGCATSNAGPDHDAGMGAIDAAMPSTADAGAEEGKPSRALLGFCSGGGWVRGDGVAGPVCFGPVDVVSVPRRVGTMTWWPGPLSHAAP